MIVEKLLAEQKLLTEHLYLELLFVGAILLFILFFNNIFLYKQKLRDRISLMLFFGIAMSFSEIIWSVCEIFGIKWLFYVGACGYCIAFVIFAAILNRYLIERMGIRLGSRGIWIVYKLPVFVFALLCLSTPWTHLVVWLDAAGNEQGGVLLYTLFYWLVLAYLLSPALIGLYFLTMGKKKKPADGEISASIFVFSVMVPVLYYLEMLILSDEMSQYVTLSLPVSLSLMYLITNVSTHTALDAKAKMEAVETDLRIASKIQTDALPPFAPEFADHLELNLRASMNTAKEVGGDFYDYFPVDENRICFLIADVSGKGTPAALFMMTAKTMIKDYALTKDSTSEIFNAVNARLCENNDAGMFATAWIGILDTRTMTLQYTNAGHNYPFLQRKDQPCELIKDRHGLFLAGMEFTKYKQSEMQLAPGDRILLYTDGVVEAHNRAKELYGEERLQKLLDDVRDCTGEQTLERIFDDVNEFAAEVPQFDDITMVVLTIK